MIEENEMLSLLVEANPGFSAKWDQLREEWEDEPSLPYYLALGSFAQHICSLLASGDEATLQNIFATIERLVVEGNDYVKEAAVVGLIENIQNQGIHSRGTSPQQFERYLLPESVRCWKKVEAFWSEGRLIVDD